MLKGLDEIEWEKLSHAYGPAGNVPGRLRSLLSDDQAIREQALAELYGVIWHQGTVYEATIFAVPFLIELLAHWATTDKAGIACLLASIADGAGGPGREARIVQRVREAAREALPLLATYLSYSQADVRALIPRALGAFPEEAADYLPRLEAALATEAEEYVREEIRGAIARLRGEQTA